MALLHELPSTFSKQLLGIDFFFSLLIVKNNTRIKVVGTFCRKKIISCLHLLWLLRHQREIMCVHVCVWGGDVDTGSVFRPLLQQSRARHAITVKLCG